VIRVFERCPRFSCPISLDHIIYIRWGPCFLCAIQKPLGPIIILFVWVPCFLCAIQKPLGPIIILFVRGPSFLHTIHVLVIQNHLDPIIYIYIYVGGLVSFVLSKNHLDPSSYYYTFGGLSFLHTIQKKRHKKKQCFLKHMRISTLAGFMCLPLSIWGPPTNVFKVQLNSCVKSSCQSTCKRTLALLLCKAWIYKGSGNIKGMT
jgi:hypothetical protein